MWDLIVSIPDHCFSFYFAHNVIIKIRKSDKWQYRFAYHAVVIGKSGGAHGM